ncbi:MAG: hypothetical protein VX642_13350 [Bdellovibrionota bacterium]|nr:hypothetical protein [Bdellovibrionota bacterium]
MLKVVLTFMIGALLSCSSTGVKSEPLPYSLDLLKRIILDTVPSELKSTSPNGREMYFEAFQLPGKFSKRPGRTKNGKLLERAWAKVVILGVTRPYTLEISIKTEELGMTKYYSTGENVEFAKSLNEKIKKRLVQRHEGADLIDDFRPF